MAVMLPRLLGAVVGLAFAGVLSPVDAATLYTDQASFDASTASMTLGWTENFNGFSTGDYSGAPISIGGGQAEIFTPGVGEQEIVGYGSGGSNAYWNVDTSGGATLQPGIATTITGNLGNAFSFNYNMGGVRDNMWEVSWVSTDGTVTAFLFETPVTYPTGGPVLFYGWIGAPGEGLAQVVLGPPSTGIVVDNIRAFDVAAVVPLPPAAWLFLTGLGMVGAAAWKQRRAA